MNKKLLPILLVISLASCNTTTNEALPQEEKPKQTEVASNENTESKEEEFSSVEEEKPAASIDDKDTLENTENDTAEEVYTTEETTSEDTDSGSSRREQIEAIKKEADNLYKEIEQVDPLLTVDGSSTAIDFNASNADEIIENLGLEFVNSEPSENGYFTNSVYKTSSDNEINITTAEDGTYLIIFNNDASEMTLPYGITNKDTPDQAREKLGDFSLREDYYADQTEEKYEYVYMATKNVSYILNYEKEMLVSVEMTYQTDDIIKQLIISQYVDSLAEDKSGTLMLESKEFSLPIKYQDLAELLGASVEDANADNIKDFFPENDSSEEIAGSVYYENKVVLTTENNKYLVEYFRDNYGVPAEPIYEDYNVSTITFFEDNEDYGFKNDKIEVNQDTITNLADTLDDANQWYDDSYGITFYLDDYNQISIYDNQVVYMSVSQRNRNMDELGLYVGD